MNSGQTKLKFATLFIILSASMTSSMLPFSGNNLGFAYDNDFILNYWMQKPEKLIDQNNEFCSWNAGFSAERTVNTYGRDKDKNKVNVAQIFGKTESLLHSMDNSVDPAVSTSDLEQFFYPPLMFTDSNGKIMEYSINAKKELTDLNFWLNIAMPIEKLGQVGVSAYMPLKFTNLFGVAATMTELPEAMQEALDGLPEFKQKLDKLELFTNQNLGGLRIDQWNNDKIWGDLQLLGSWNQSFVFENYKNSWLNLFLKAGLIIPTAPARDQDCAFSTPRGFDNALGVPLIVGLNAFCNKNIRAGAVGEVLLFTHDKNARRLKKTVDQSELLISDKVIAKRSPGNIYRLTALVEAKTEDNIFSGLIAWQYLRKQPDKFSDFKTPGYDSKIVNSSEFWQRKEFHNLIFKFNVDFKALTKEKIAPKLSFIYRLPIFGRRIESYHTLGLNFTVNL